MFLGLGLSIKPGSAAAAGVSAPTNTVAPVVTGTGRVGQTLSCSTGTWTGSPVSYTYLWKRGGVSTGVTTSTYALTAPDAASAMTCEVTANNGQDSSPATSNTVNVAALLGDPVELGTPLVVNAQSTGFFTTNVALAAGGGFTVYVSLYGTSDTLSSITDNSGNSYTYNIQSVQGSGSGNRKVYSAWVSAPNGLASGTVFTINLSGATGRRIVRVIGYSGAPALEAHAGTGGNSAGPIAINVPTSGTIANLSALELLVSINGDATVTGGSVDSDFTIIGTDTSSGGSGSPTGFMRLRWRRATTTAQVNFSETISGSAEWAVAYDTMYGV
jgi:hypothetical protein